jgi:hypothetical protein
MITKPEMTLTEIDENWSVIIARAEHLFQLTYPEFGKVGFDRDDITISVEGVTASYEYNDSCNCHPEYVTREHFWTHDEFNNLTDEQIKERLTIEANRAAQKKEKERIEGETRQKEYRYKQYLKLKAEFEKL